MQLTTLLLFEVILQVQGFEELGAYFTGGFCGFIRALVVQRDGLAQRIYHDTAVLAFSGMRSNFLAEFIAESSIHKIGQENQQRLALG
jgi:ABC-type uncharacterized transport system permease subunit